MSKQANHSFHCVACGKEFALRDVVVGGIIRDEIAKLILNDHPQWSLQSYICKPDLNRYRTQYVHSLLESEKGDLSTLEQEVVYSLQAHDVLAKDLEAEFNQEWTFGEKMADRIAAFGGSWTFLIVFALFMLLWIVLNTFILVSRPPDPYPFILLNLILSGLASVQAPIIMMSQNRQEAKDRLRSQHDYQINLKAELEIRHLHEKVDHLLSHQWERLARIQEIQLEVLAEISKRN